MTNYGTITSFILLSIDYFKHYIFIYYAFTLSSLVYFLSENK